MPSKNHHSSILEFYDSSNLRRQVFGSCKLFLVRFVHDNITTKSQLENGLMGNAIELNDKPCFIQRSWSNARKSNSRKLDS